MNRTRPASLQTGTKLIDDFLRRELRVGDPKDATEVATALGNRYASERAKGRAVAGSASRATRCRAPREA